MLKRAAPIHGRKHVAPKPVKIVGYYATYTKINRYKIYCGFYSLNEPHLDIWEIDS